MCLLLRRHCSEVTLPKLVVVENRGLACCFAVLTVLFFVIVVFILFEDRSWSKVASGTTLTQVIINSDATYQHLLSGSIANTSCQNDASVGVNTSLRLYGSDWTQVVEGCQAFCTWEEVENNTCSGPREPLDAVSTRSLEAVFVASGYRELDDTSQSRTVQLLPQAAGASFTFKYEYAIDLNKEDLLLKITLSPADLVRGSNANARTLLLGTDQKTKKVWEPGQEIKLTAAQLLEVAQDMTGELPSTRTSGNADEIAAEVLSEGVELLCAVQCYNNNRDMLMSHHFPHHIFSVTTVFSMGSVEDEYLAGVNTRVNEPTCILEVIVVRLGVSRQVAGDPSRTTPAMQQIGVLVTTATGHGHQRFANFSAILSMLTCAGVIVFLLPRKLIRFVTMHCLGRLSKIYKELLVEPFDLKRDISAMSMMLVMNSAPFLELADVVHNDSSHFISKRTMHKNLHASLQQISKMNEVKIATVSEFAFAEVQYQSLCGSSDRPADLDLNSFSASLMTSDQMDFSNIVGLFDPERRAGPIERLFTPKRVREGVNEARKQADEVAAAKTQPLNDVDSARAVTSQATVRLASEKGRRSLEESKISQAEDDRLNAEAWGKLTTLMQNEQKLIDKVHTQRSCLENAEQECVNLETQLETVLDWVGKLQKLFETARDDTQKVIRQSEPDDEGWSAVELRSQWVQVKVDQASRDAADAVAEARLAHDRAENMIQEMDDELDELSRKLDGLGGGANFSLSAPRREMLPPPA